MVIKRNYPLLADNLERVEYVSDSSFMIRKVGTNEVYGSAVELADTVVEYEETDVLIDDALAEDTATVEDYQNALAEFVVKL